MNCIFAYLIIWYANILNRLLIFIVNKLYGNIKWKYFDILYTAINMHVFNTGVLVYTISVSSPKIITSISIFLLSSKWGVKINSVIRGYIVKNHDKLDGWYPI